MIKIALAFALVCALGVDAHMWLLQPVSRGGTASIGGTTAPCNGLKAGTGTVTNLVMGAVNTIVFRVNKHGEGPFRIAISPNGDDAGYDTPANILASNFKYTITADGGDNFNEMHVNITMPNVAMPKASLQLKGMGDANNVGAWYQCASITLGPAPSCPAACQTGTPVHGKCQGVKCVCNAGFSGADCSISVAVNGGVNAAVTVSISPEKFDKTVFLNKLSAAVSVPATSIEIVSVSVVKNHADQTMVAFTFKDTPTQTALATANRYNDYVANAQIDVGYPIVSSSSAGNTVSQDQINTAANNNKKKTSGGAIAAAIIVPIAVIGIGAAAFFMIKKKGASSGGSRSAAPAVPMRI